MKKITLLFAALILGFVSYGQTITLTGQVTDQLTGLPVANHVVYMYADSISGVNYWGVDTTDANGNYSDVVSVPANTAVDFYISTNDCVNNWLNNTVQLAANGTTTGLPANFVICDSVAPGSCSANFTSTTINGSYFNFAATATGTGAIAYGWDFGDGTVWNPSTSASNVGHGYTTPGTYIVCLTITDASSCTSTFCDSVVVAANSNCNSFYTISRSVVPNRVYFYGSPTPNFGNTYAWDMGDGNTYTTRNPIHDYQNAGTYIACLTITNNNGCTDTYCDSIVVTQGAGPCVASFTAALDTNSTNSFTFANTSTYNNLPARAFWDFGDGNTSNGYLTTSHTYLAAGTYTVCLIITSGNCTDSTCQTVVVTSAPPVTCNAAFTHYVDTTNQNQVYFSSSSSASAPGITYSWDFGDGNSISGSSSWYQNPSHYYSQPGTYTACLIISVGNCADTTCQTVVTTGPVSPYWITGSVMAGNNYAQDGVAYLITYDNTTQLLTAVDTMSLDSMGYNFQVMPGGSYTVKVALTATDPDYASYLPTYLGDSLLWSGATFLTANQNHYSVINLTAGTNPGGPGFVGGNVQQGANKDEGDPVVGVPVLLFDVNMQPVAYTYSNQVGDYSFSNLAYGTYYVYPEMMNLPTTPLMVTISANEPSVTGAIMVVNSTGINGFLLTSIDFQVFSDAGKVSPNPTTGLVELAFNLRQATTISAQVMDLSGKALIVNSDRFTAGEQRMKLDLTTLPSGVYVIKTSNEVGESFFSKLVKR